MLKKIIIIFLVFYNLQGFAQQEKVVLVENKPKYKQSKPNYILNKITYTEKYTILKFTYICTWEGGGCYFFGTEHWERWFLEDVKAKKKYHFVEIRNIRRGKTLEKSKIITEDYYHVRNMKKGEEASCEIYFEHLPNSVNIVDLIEGDRNESNNFHCFDIQIKSFKKQVQEAQAEY